MRRWPPVREELAAWQPFPLEPEGLICLQLLRTKPSLCLLTAAPRLEIGATETLLSLEFLCELSEGRPWIPQPCFTWHLLLGLLGTGCVQKFPGPLGSLGRLGRRPEEPSLEVQRLGGPCPLLPHPGSSQSSRAYAPILCYLPPKLRFNRWSYLVLRRTKWRLRGGRGLIQSHPAPHQPKS